MLNFENDIDVASSNSSQARLQTQSSLPQGTHSLVSAETFAASASASSSVASSEPDAEFRRINLADKRIINGSTDVNQLVPFKYK